MSAKYTEGMLRDGALEGKTIVVTGGGTGLGRSMSRYFLELGANVVITSRKMEVLEKTAAELAAETGGQVLPVQCDVRDHKSVEALLAATLERFGAVHSLLNNAAGNFISPTERLSPRAVDTVVDIVLRGSYNCTLIFGKHWIEAKQPASVLSIVTSYAWTGSAYVVPSAMGKAGVLAMTRSLAVEWAKYGIRLNAVAPGPFPTKGAWDRLFPKEAIPAEMLHLFDEKAQVPLQRVGEHQELANIAAYLVSDYSAYVTGDCMTIDGGEWLQGAGQFSHFEAIPQPYWDLIEQVVRSKK